MECLFIYVFIYFLYIFKFMKIKKKSIGYRIIQYNKNQKYI